MKNKLLSIIFAIAFVFSFVPLGAFQITANAAVFKGSGTANDPYQIASKNDLFKLAELINDENTNPKYRYCYYIQTKDIDLEEKLWTPIGIFYGSDGETLTANALFAGSYDGNYHTVTNLKIDYSTDYCGLFGRIGQANYDNSNCIIKNLSVEGDVISSMKIVGGIVGEIGYGSTVSNCSFRGVVNGDNYVGGISGNIHCGGNILSSYCNVNISGCNAESKVGGIVGLIKVGDNTSVGSSDMILKNCYMTGTVEGASKGGICGESIIYDERENSTINYSNNYYLYTACGGGVNGENVSGCTKLSSVALKACADMLGSPFVDNNEENFNEGYPIFEWQSTPYQFKGSGTAEDPYQISSKEELEKMRDLVNSTYFNPIYGHAYYIQTTDIDLENESWIPIGLGYNDTENGIIGQGTYNCNTRMFFGDYNGNGKSILNLNVNGNWKEAGLFGFIQGGNSHVHELIVHGNVSSDSDDAGGIVGQMQYGAILNQCAFIGNVSSENIAGGVVGYIWAGGSVLNCYHNGMVSSNGISGGVTGRIRFGEYNSEGDTSVVKNCYHVNGTVTGESYSGGITGDCIYYKGINNTIEITNCYFTTGTAKNITNENATVDTTYALPGSLMKRIAEDLGSAYVENSNNALNNGYPVFKWQIKSEVTGDVNNDREFNVSDAVLLQKWLLAVPNVELANWKAADFCEDDRLDVFDLCLMKRALVEQIS